MSYWCDAHYSEYLEYVGENDVHIFEHIEKEHGDECGCKDDFIKFEEDHIVEE